MFEITHFSLQKQSIVIQYDQYVLFGPREKTKRHKSCPKSQQHKFVISNERASPIIIIIIIIISVIIT